MSWSGELISSGLDAKTKKGDKLGYATGIIYLAPDEVAASWIQENMPELAERVRLRTLCPFAGRAGCSKACLYTAGRGAMSNVQLARIKKAVMWLSEPDKFKDLLVKDLKKFVKYCDKQGVKPAVRLNGTSDVLWENEFPELFDEFKGVQFYDYTKVWKRAYRSLPDNYDLTLSYSGADKQYASDIWKAHKETGKNVAVVYRTRGLVEQMMTMTSNVVDGDEHDLRFLDTKGKIVGLYAKGQAKKDTTGFVVD